MSFYEFLETKLINESSDELSFIRVFFENSAAAGQFDNTSLLVFADWLDDRDDPRGQLIRLAVSHGFFHHTESRRLARQLGIPNHVDRMESLDGESYIIFDFVTKDNRIAFYTKDCKFYSEDQREKPIDFINKYPDLISPVFWTMIGWGI